MAQQLSLNKVKFLNQLVRTNGVGSSFVYDNSSWFVGRPISNLINTCYIGSIIQCLNPFDQMLKKIIEHKFQHESVYIEKDYQLLKSYVEFLYNGLNKRINQKPKIYRTLQFTFFDKLFDSELRYFFRQFEQNDAHEFLIQFIEYVDNCIIEIEIGKRGLRPNEQLSNIHDTYSKTHNLMSKNFVFNTLQLMECNQSSFHEKRIESTNICLQLPVRIDSKTIEDCLQNYFDTESIENINCNQCNCQQTFKSKLSICKINQNLIVMLNRFKVS